MGIESPMLSAFVARMATPEITLASWGSLVYPISLAIEGPIIMLLTASTALSENRKAYNKQIYGDYVGRLVSASYCISFYSIILFFG